jgi:hypothetical protein
MSILPAGAGATAVGVLANGLEADLPELLVALVGVGAIATVIKTFSKFVHSGGHFATSGSVGGTRPQAALQSAIEKAHNSGDTDAESKLTSQLSDPAMNPNYSMSADERAAWLKKMRGI